jgi:hypothetical protein
MTTSACAAMLAAAQVPVAPMAPTQAWYREAFPCRLGHAGGIRALDEFGERGSTSDSARRPAINSGRCAADHFRNGEILALQCGRSTRTF